MPKVTRRIVLPPAVGAYVSLFEPRDPPAGSQGKPRYSLVLLYPKATYKASLAEFAKLVHETAVEKWGPEKGPTVVKKMRWPVIADGDERYPDDPTFKGMMFVRASSTAEASRLPPQVVGPDARTRLATDEEAYSGCTFRVAVRLFPFDTAGNAGIGVGLDAVQVVKRGERMDGRRSAEETFAEYAEAGEAGEADGLLG